MTDKELAHIHELARQYVQKDNALFYRFIAFWWLLLMVGLIVAPLIGNYLATH